MGDLGSSSCFISLQPERWYWIPNQSIACKSVCQLALQSIQLVNVWVLLLKWTHSSCHVELHHYHHYMSHPNLEVTWCYMILGQSPIPESLSTNVNKCQQVERERLHETVVFTMTQFGDVPLEWKGWTVSNETDPNHGAAHKRLPTVDKPSAKAEANELPAAVHLCHTRGHRLSDFQGAPEAFLNRYALMLMYSQICVLVNTMSEYIYKYMYSVRPHFTNSQTNPNQKWAHGRLVPPISKAS